MKGVREERVGDMYFLHFNSYDNMLRYINQKRPSQLSISFDGEKLTGSIPVAYYRVSQQNEAPE